jgi:DNA-binding GntR family transcriptional regulator
MRPGERLVEAKIAQHMGVSRGPVREAIMELERQGLVTNVPRKGASVVEWSENDVEEIYTLRMVLEGLAARLAATRITDEQCQELQHTVDSLRRGCDMEESIELDLHFHEGLCEAADHTRLQEALAGMRMQTELFVTRTRLPREPWSGPEHMVRDHQAVLDAVRSGEPDLAERRMREHIETSGLWLIEKMSEARESM